MYIGEVVQLYFSNSKKRGVITIELLERLDAEKCALLVIDVQNDFCDPNGLCSIEGKSLERIDLMVSNIKRCILSAHKRGIPVIFIRTEHNSNVDSTAWSSRHQKSSGNKNKKSIKCKTGTWGAEFYSISPKEQDLVITKNRYSAFVGTNLHIVLQSCKRESLIFTGLETNVCVESTLRDALSHDYYITLVEDACTAPSMEEHESTVRNVRNKFGFVVKSSDIFEYWK